MELLFCRIVTLPTHWVVCPYLHYEEKFEAFLSVNISFWYQEEMEMNEMHHFLMCADVDLLGAAINTVKKKHKLC